MVAVTTMNLEQLLVLVLMCFVVPGATAIAPARSTRSRIMRAVIHLGCIGGFFYALRYASDGTLQRCVIGLAFVVLLQYWASVLLVAAYERQLRTRTTCSDVFSFTSGFTVRGSADVLMLARCSVKWRICCTGRQQILALKQRHA